MMSEFAPPAARGRFIVLLESFWGVGWLAAALISYLIIPFYGWHMAFFLGALPALYVMYIRKAMPESVRYLLDVGRVTEAHDIVCRLERAAGITPTTEVVAAPPTVKLQPRFTDLWSTGFAQRTLVLWIIWFGIVYSYYGIFTWLPSLMVGQGYPMLKTFEYVLVMTLAQLPGYFTAAYLVDVIGRKATLGGFLSLSALCAYFFGQGGEPLIVLAWGSMMSFFNLGAWGVVYTYTPELYPTSVRAFASGWAAAVGRAGGIVAPTIVGYMLTGSSGFKGIFAMFTVVMLGVAIAIGILGEETKGKTLDEISLQ
jgi:putative MFS transporter